MALRTLVCSLTFAWCVAFAQAPAAGGEAAKLMRLNVVVDDGHGGLIGDLSAADFHITDDGKPQHIALFRNAGQKAASTGAQERSNRPEPHTVAILFDFFNESQPDRLEASRRIGQSLKQLESGESLYFYMLFLDGSLSPIRAIDSAGDSAGKTWTQNLDALLAKAVKSHGGNRPTGITPEDVVKKTYVALETIAKQLATFPGRRDIVWVTNDIPNVSNTKLPCSGDWVDCSLYVPHLVVWLDRYGTVVNPLSYSSNLGPDGNLYIQDMASLTGGHPFFSEDMRSVLKQLDDQPAGAYAIAYEPAKDNWNSKFHKIKVTCERKGVRVQARGRYYALPGPPDANARVHDALVAAFQSPADVSDIGLRASVSPAASPNTLHIEMHVDASDLLLREAGGQFADQLTVLYSIRSASGPQGDPTVAPVDVRLTSEQRQTAVKDGIPVSRDLAVDAATRTVRLIVLDGASNSVGSLTVPIPAR